MHHTFSSDPHTDAGCWYRSFTRKPGRHMQVGCTLARSYVSMGETDAEAFTLFPGDASFFIIFLQIATLELIFLFKRGYLLLGSVNHGWKIMEIGNYGSRTASLHNTWASAHPFSARYLVLSSPPKLYNFFVGCNLL